MEEKKQPPYTLPILPYCLAHGCSFQPGHSQEGDGPVIAVLDCPMCIYEVVVYGRKAHSIRLEISEQQFEDYTAIFERMDNEGLPGTKLM